MLWVAYARCGCAACVLWPMVHNIRAGWTARSWSVGSWCSDCADVHPADTKAGCRSFYVGIDRIPHLECFRIVPNASMGARMLFVELDPAFYAFQVQNLLLLLATALQLL